MLFIPLFLLAALLLLTGILLRQHSQKIAGWLDTNSQNNLFSLLHHFSLIYLILSIVGFSLLFFATDVLVIIYIVVVLVASAIFSFCLVRKL